MNCDRLVKCFQILKLESGLSFGFICPYLGRQAQLYLIHHTNSAPSCSAAPKPELQEECITLGGIHLALHQI
jgi:hypothetical protein